ncbi:respiratory chain complex I subunit 1 family protein [Trichlorobacter ammonificans]|uniref:Ech-hydrogenase-like complex NuoH-like integral membrane subunit n=1 Tax=Trichlorobacter ammonificans TaxID=2916410 RepID=A0ABM9D7R6_9BACT|nr:NADH-quinone oxidoreductase subunit H [Trichlorobacter ammonificans]CAH2030449.1 Ech-hydrogenase-like complex NuoH-like integral membrane subunit [Trichlorobacter ammonificans]
MADTLIHILLLLTMPPLLLGVINRVKAIGAGRRGAPLLQPYHDLWRLLRKGTVFSRTTTWVFRAGPLVTLAATATAALMVPFGGHEAPVSFSGDLLLFAYLFALARFCTTLAALDTGSSFEGMGAAREVTFGCLAEPVLFIVLVALARESGSLSLTVMLTYASGSMWPAQAAPLLLMVAALFILFLVENCRIPFDDPTTHLELTMIHEVMVLDHSGPAFGAILYAAALKLFVLGALVLHVALPFSDAAGITGWAGFVASLLALAILVGIVESAMARLRLLKIPQVLLMAAALAAFALLLTVR